MAGLALNAARKLLVPRPFICRARWACFAAGFAVTAYPVDYRTAGSKSLSRPFAFVSEGLKRTDIAAKEWIGLGTYYVAGRTADLFPGP